MPLPARLSRGDLNGLHEALHQRGRARRRREACKWPPVRHRRLRPRARRRALSDLSLSVFQTCCRCRARRRCLKKFSIQRFPKVLVLRILRTMRPGRPGSADGQGPGRPQGAERSGPFFHVCSSVPRGVPLSGDRPCYLDSVLVPCMSLTRFLPDLKRFSESRVRTSKLTTFVNFPLRDLDLREFASENTSECFFN